MTKKTNKKENENSPKKRGRPSAYNEEIANEICTRLRNGETMLHICQDESIPVYSTVSLWMQKSREGDEFYNNFSERCKQARALGAFAMVEEAKAIAEDTSRDLLVQYNNKGDKFYTGNNAAVARDKLRVQTNMRIAAMWNSMCQPQERPAVEVNVGSIELIPPKKPEALHQSENVIDITSQKKEKIENK